MENKSNPVEDAVVIVLGVVFGLIGLSGIALLITLVIQLWRNMQ